MTVTETKVAETQPPIDTEPVSVRRTQMRVRKRNGDTEPVDVNKIVRAVERCAGGLDDVDPLRVATKTISGLYDGATTAELDRLSIETAAQMIGEEPEYSRLAARLLAGYIAKVIRSNDHAVVLHQGPSGIDGIFIGMLVQQFFTFETTAMDVLFYVRPERRGSRAAVRLFRAFKAWARSSGAKAIQVGTMTGIDPSRTAKFYRGMGLNEIGGVYHGPAE